MTPDLDRHENSGSICVRNVCKAFKNRTVLDQVSLEVNPGEIVALLGPNGAGKSTLMRTIATVILPDSGQVLVDGIDVIRDPLGARTRVGVTLGDERSWTWRISGRNNLLFYAALYGFGRNLAETLVEQVLAAVNLSDAADLWFVNYSTGMRMRLSLARALLPAPPILLLDEPTRSLDPIAATSFRNHVRTIATNRKLAVLYATHDLHEASSIADMVAVLHLGRIVHRLPAGTNAADLEKALLETVKAT